MKLASFLAGVVLYAFIVLLGFSFDGGHLESLAHPAALFIVAFAPFPALFIGYGAGGAFRHLGAALRGVPFPESGGFFSLWISSAYGSALLFFLLELFVTSGFIAAKPSVIFEKAMASLAAPVFALLLAEGVLCPLRHRLARR